MAKRGYRGKHPHNDMKVSKHSESTSKRNPKLDAEYAKLHPKQKYSYIRDHQGFFPQATGTITISGNVADEKTITLVSIDGTSKAYLSADSENLTTDPPKFKRAGGDNDVIATSIKDCINHANGHNGKIVATVDGAVVTVTQKDTGPDGNITITTSAASNVALTGFTGG